MDRELKKIAVACFVGGVLCSSIAFLVNPKFWWLGIIAGLAGGYIGYEFREFYRAIPVALRAAWADTAEVFGALAEMTKGWFSRTFPFFTIGVVGAASILLTQGSIPIGNSWSDVIWNISVLMVVMSGGIGYPLFALAVVGANFVDKSDFRGNTIKGCKQVPLTCRRAFRWMGLGIVGILVFICYGVWEIIFRFLRKFLWELFIKVHSQKRVLCAIDGTLGGVTAYFYAKIWLVSLTAFSEQALLVMFGGLLGAMFGIVNYEVFSKRILKSYIRFNT